LIRGIVALWRALERHDAHVAASHSRAAREAHRTPEDPRCLPRRGKHLLVRQGILRNTIVRGPAGWAMSDDVRATWTFVDDLIAAIP